MKNGSLTSMPIIFAVIVFSMMLIQGAAKIQNETDEEKIGRITRDLEFEGYSIAKICTHQDNVYYFAYLDIEGILDGATSVFDTDGKGIGAIGGLRRPSELDTIYDTCKTLIIE